jgi:hypothetical protein
VQLKLALQFPTASQPQTLADRGTYQLFTSQRAHIHRVKYNGSSAKTLSLFEINSFWREKLLNLQSVKERAAARFKAQVINLLARFLIRAYLIRKSWGLVVSRSALMASVRNVCE